MATVRKVRPAGGDGYYTTIALALAAVDDPGDIIELHDSVSESVNLTTKIGGFRSKTGEQYTWTSPNGFNPGLNFNVTSAGGDIDIERINFVNDNGNSNLIKCTNLHADLKVSFSQCSFQANATYVLVYINYPFGSSINVGKGFEFDRCIFDIADKDTLTLYIDDSRATSSEDSLRITNSIFINDDATTTSNGTIRVNQTDKSVDFVSIKNTTMVSKGNYTLESQSGNPYVYLENCIIKDGTSGSFSWTTNLTYLNCAFDGSAIVGADSSNMFDVDFTTAGLNFTDSASGDFTTPEGSVFINAGKTNSLTTDYAGNPRPVDTVDIGAYENQTPIPPAGTTQEPVIVNPSKITSGQNSGQAGSVFSSRVDEYNETSTSSLSAGGSGRDISNIDDNTKSSTGTNSGGVINDGGNDVVTDNAIEPAKTIPNAGNRFSR